MALHQIAHVNGAVDVAREINRAYVEIEDAKVHLKGIRKNIPPLVEARLYCWARQIMRFGIELEHLSALQILAAIFLVNFVFHQSKDKAERIAAAKCKLVLQAYVIVRHADRVRITSQKTGLYAGTQEIAAGVWTSHIPNALFKKVLQRQHPCPQSGGKRKRVPRKRAGAQNAA